MIPSEGDRIEAVVYKICMRRMMVEAEGWPQSIIEYNA